MLSLVADQLHVLGFRGMGARSLKPKHVEALLRHWRRDDISVGTIKNRMAALRWWSQKVDRQNVIARSNAHYGIPERSFVIDGLKAKTVDPTDLEKVRDPHVRMSLELQRAFGLRREEAIKFAPSYADKGDRLLSTQVIFEPLDFAAPADHAPAALVQPCTSSPGSPP